MEMSITIPVVADSYESNPQAITIKHDGGYVKITHDNRTITLSRGKLEAALEALKIVESK